MKKTVLFLLCGAIFLGCASLGTPASPDESCLVVKVEVRNPDNTPTENAFRLKFSHDLSYAVLSPKNGILFIKRDFPENAMTMALRQFNTGNYVGTEEMDIPYKKFINLKPGEIGIFKEKLVFYFMKGSTPNSYRMRWEMTALTPQERSNIIKEVEKNPEIANWRWSAESVEGLHLGNIPLN